MFVYSCFHSCCTCLLVVNAGFGKMSDQKHTGWKLFQLFLSNPPNARSIRNPRREGNLITKNPIDADYHNTYNNTVPQKPKTEINRAQLWLSMTVQAREIPQELTKTQKKKRIQKSGPPPVAYRQKTVKALEWLLLILVVFC